MTMFIAPVSILMTLLHIFLCGTSADLSAKTLTTRSESTITTTPASTEATTSDIMGCNDSCAGKTSGNYQYCQDCSHYMTCIDGYKLIMPCAANLAWDDGMKLCYWTSSTCNTPGSKITTVTSSTGCDDSCVGKTSGNYQYCPDCHHYMICIDGNKYIMPCPSSLLWDDQRKMCFWTSSTCAIPTNDTTTASSNTDRSEETVRTRPESIVTTRTTTEATAFATTESLVKVESVEKPDLSVENDTTMP